MSENDEKHDTALGSKDGIAAAALLGLFVVMLAATWQRWTHPIIDHPREMNIPARILAGDRLYIDVFSHYGPFATYFNALLYRIFGTQISTLHASGLACAALILAMLYWLARQLLGARDAALATALVVVTCAFASYLGNFVQPYAYAALYGWAFALASTLCLVRFATSRRASWLLWTSVFVGLTAASKPEQTLVAVAPICALFLVDGIGGWRASARQLLIVFVPAVVVSALAYGPVFLWAPWQDVLADVVAVFRSPQVEYFARRLDGRGNWPSTGWAIVASAGMTAVACAVVALCGLVFDVQPLASWRRHWVRVAPCAVAGWLLWALPPRGAVPLDITPLRTAPIVLVAIVVVILVEAFRAKVRQERIPPGRRILIILAVFGLASISRVAFNLSLRTPYTIFTVPPLIVIYVYLFQTVIPSVLLSSRRRAQTYARRAGAVLLASVVAILASQHAIIGRARNTDEISTRRGRLLTTRSLAAPINQAVRFAVEHTQPEDAIAALPQASLIYFLSERRNPLRDETFIPGLLTPARERETIGRLDQSSVNVILISNWTTPEFRDATFGVDYGTTLMQWIKAHYHLATIFRDPGATSGDDAFLISAFVRNR